MHADYGAPFGSGREDTMQYRAAAVISETQGASLLNYGFMDAGFFTAAGLTPDVKYFHQTNVPLEEMLSEQNRYIEEGLCDYVVTRGKQPESIQITFPGFLRPSSPAVRYMAVVRTPAIPAVMERAPTDMTSCKSPTPAAPIRPEI